MIKPLIYVVVLSYALAFSLMAIHALTGKDAAKLPSRLVLSVGLLVHTAVLLMRTIEAGHTPILSIFETLLFYSWCIILVSLIVVLRYEERLTVLLNIPIACIALVFALFNETPPKALTLILRTWWFEIHVITSFASYALFTLSFSAAVVYLLKYISKDGKSSAGHRNMLDMVNRGILWGFFLFSVSMFSGAVWGYLAWGTYWLWEPKVIWSFIVWFYYAGAMHVSYIKEWRNTGSAVAAVLGFIIVLFTYLGVGLLMKSSHSF